MIVLGQSENRARRIVPEGNARPATQPSSIKRSYTMPMTRTPDYRGLPTQQLGGPDDHEGNTFSKDPHGDTRSAN